MDWTGLAFAVGVVALFTAATARGRDAIALGFARGVTRVSRVVGAPDARGARTLRAFVYRAATLGEGASSVVLAPSQAAVAGALIQGEGATGVVDCLRTPYRIVRAGADWAVVALPPWLSFLGTTSCEHGDHAQNVAAARDLETLRARYAPRGEVEDLLLRILTEMDAVAGFHRAFLESEVWMVGASGSVGTEGAPSAVRLVIVPWQGREMIPVFTAEHRLPPVPPGTSVGKVPVRLLLAVIPEDGPHPVVINPGSAVARVLEAAELRALRRG